MSLGLPYNLDDFWPRYCRAIVLDLSRRVEAFLQIELTPNFSNVGGSICFFSGQKKSRAKESNEFLSGTS